MKLIVTSVFINETITKIVLEININQSQNIYVSYKFAFNHERNLVR